MAGSFELKPSEGQFMFNLKGANGEIVLTSERYANKAGAQNGIASVKTNAPIDARYDKLTSKNQEPYFVLKAANGEVIGTSETYSSTGKRDDGIAFVKANAPSAPTKDLS